VRTIAICTQKGGVGKTTAAANLAAAWGQLGRSVLAIDLDPQFALTRRFGADPAAGDTIYDVVESAILRDATQIALDDVIRHDVVAGVDLIASRRELANIELTLAGLPRRELVLRRCLRQLQAHYDYTLIDCPPNLGLLTVNALCAADEAVIPLDMKSVDALAGAEELIATAQALEEDAPRVTALVRNRVEGSLPHRRRVYRAIDAELEHLGLPIAATLIPARDAFEHSAIAHAPLVSTQPDHIGSQAFRDLATELEAAA
jgi:chromosome partitioning protein